MKLCLMISLQKSFHLYSAIEKLKKKKSYMDHLYYSHMYLLNVSPKFEQTCMKEKERKSQRELVFMYHTPL